MVHRIALVGGALAAIGSWRSPWEPGTCSPVRTGADGSARPMPTAAPTAQTQVDTVYVKPAPPQQVIHVTAEPSVDRAADAARGGHQPAAPRR